MGEMFSATAFTIRDAEPGDWPELVRLGWEDLPAGRIFVGEIGGVVAAALAVDEHRAVVADHSGAPRLLAHMRARASAIQATRRTPLVGDRIRERMRRRVPRDLWALVAALPARYG
jgi:hypothetical protein